MIARYPGRYEECGTDICVGEQIIRAGEGWIHTGCQDSEYADGRAEGAMRLAERKMYGPALAERFHAEDDFNHYWKHGEDY